MFHSKKKNFRIVDERSNSAVCFLFNSSYEAARNYKIQFERENPGKRYKFFVEE
jgi:hypothetical protein